MKRKDPGSLSEYTQITEKLDKMSEAMETIMQLQDSISSKSDEISEQSKEIMRLTLIIAERDKTILERDQAIADQKETIEYLKKMLYGRKSERSKYYEIPGQMDMYDLYGIEGLNEDTENTETERRISGYTRREKKKKATYEEIYKNLPAEKVVIPVSGEDRKCPYCGEEMEHLGEKFVRHEIDVIPAKVIHKEIYQETVICESCKADDAPVIAGARVPEALIQHSPATPSSVAYAMYMKYINSVPLYRQEKDWMRMGVSIPRVTLSNWIIDCADRYLRPVKERLHERLLERLVICADETPCQVLKEKGKTPQSKSYMWLYCTADDGKPPIAIYDYQPGRHGEHARDFLEGFKGKYVVCDGYQGYNKLPDSVTRCGCLAHVRRKWADAIPPDRRKRKPDGKAVPAEIGFDYCNRLFELERKLRESDDPDEHRRIREKKEPEVWSEFWDWLSTVHASGKSRLGIAVNYTLGQKPYLMNYLEDESIPISNNFAENAARPYAIGRKNFLFHNSVDGADTSAVIYSVTESAKRNGLNVLDYLILVLDKMRGCDGSDRSDLIEELMPWSEKVQEICKPGIKKAECSQS